MLFFQCQDGGFCFDGSRVLFDSRDAQIKRPGTDFQYSQPRPDSLHVQLVHSGTGKKWRVHFGGTIRKTLVITNFNQTLKSPLHPAEDGYFKEANKGKVVKANEPRYEQRIVTLEMSNKEKRVHVLLSGEFINLLENDVST